MEIQCQGQASEVYQKIKAKFTAYKSQGKLSFVTDIEFDDGARRAIATGKGFKSTLQCQDGKVVVDLDLNFLLKPLRSQIEAGLQKTIAKVLS